jgi:hypothetical protein
MGGEGCFCCVLLLINFICMGWVYNDMKSMGRSDTEAGLWAVGTLFLCFIAFPVYLGVRQSYVDERLVQFKPPTFPQQGSSPSSSTFDKRVRQFVTPVNPETAKKIEMVHQKLEEVLPAKIVQKIDRAVEKKVQQVEKKVETARREAGEKVTQYRDVFDAMNDNAFQAARVFLDHIQDINLKDTKGATILHRAAEKGNREFVELLLSKLADMNEEDNDGKTALHRACASGQKEVAEFLLSRGAAINVKDYDGHTPLFDAALAGQEKMVELLVSHGAVVNLRNYEEKSLLTLLTGKGKQKMADFLRSHGAHDLF